MTAGAECYAYVGGPCGQSPGAHIHEDWAVVQAVDPATGREVADGEWGNLTVTTLDRDNGLLRYDLEEACAILREPCPCGETSIRGLWGGRFKDLLSCQGTRFQLNELEARAPGDRRRAQALPRVPGGPPGRRRPPAAGAGGGGVRGPGRAGGGRRAVRRRAAPRRWASRAEVEVLARDTIPRAGYKATRVIEP